MSTSTKVPSVRKLEASGNNATAVVEAWHRDLVRDIEGLMDGSITPWDGSTKARELRKSRWQLRRLIENGRAVGVEMD